MSIERSFNDKNLTLSHTLKYTYFKLTFYWKVPVQSFMGKFGIFPLEIITITFNVIKKPKI
jgi:hypothetical protein